MPKFMVSLRDENFRLLVLEAKRRGISIQELLRAVIIPDWAMLNTRSRLVAGEPISLRPSPAMGKNRDVQTLFSRIKD